MAGPKGIRLTKEFLTRRYIDDGATMIMIGAEKGVSHVSVWYWLKKHGIPIRTRKEAASVMIEKCRACKPSLERTLDSGGYWQKMKHGHHRANYYGYVKEHILVWEEAHGKPVPGGWVVHHENGVKTDNRPENLRAFSRGDHTRLHNLMRSNCAR